MLDITTELKDLYKTDYLPYRSEPVQKDLKFTFTDPELVIENDKVVAGSFDLQESLNSSEDLAFGSCEAATLKVKFADITQDINGKTFVLTQTVDGTEIKLGTFTVDSAIEQDNRRFLEVTAYDNMRKFDRDVVSWYESLTFPTHLKHMRESLCDYCGVEYAPLPTAQGSSIKLNSNYNSKLELLKLQGKSVQNGTPTPTTPVAIQSVGDNGSVVVKVTGKNILNLNAMNKSSSLNSFSVSNGTVIMNAKAGAQYAQLEYPMLLKAGTYTMSTKSVDVVGVDSFRGIGMFRIQYFDDNNVYRGIDLAREERAKTFTLNKDRNITIIMFAVGADRNTADVTVTITEPMLELGSTKSLYESYKEQLIIIPLTQPLRSVGSVYDRVVKKAGVWGVDRKFASVVFDGSDDEGWFIAATNTTGVNRFGITPTNKIKPVANNDTVGHVLCDKLQTVTAGQTYNLVNGIALNTTEIIYLYYESVKGYTRQEFMTWLTINPLTVIYELATPTFEPFAQSVQDKLNALQTYQGVTNIFTTDTLQPNMIVEYNYLPNDYMTVTKTLSTNTLNGLEVLRSLEQLNGAFGHIGRDGKLQHKVLSKTVIDDTIPSGSYKTLKYEKYSTKPIDKLQINQEDGDIGAISGNGTNCYQIQSNFLVYGKSAGALQTIADNAATNILGITYVPYTCEMLGLPYLEAGDRVSFGTAITSYILTRNIKGIQAITDSIETKGNEEIVQVKSINTEVKQLRGKTNVLTRDVEKMESTITEFDKQINVLLPGPWYPDGSLLPCKNNMTNLEYEFNSKILQTAKEITTEVNNVSEQLNSQISQTATSITTQVNDLTKNMNSQFEQTASSISTKVEKNGIISSINQSAESITINANKINLTGYATFSGLADGTTVINGGCITTGTIDASVVNVTNIKAENIQSGTLNGFAIKGATIDAVTVISNTIKVKNRYTGSEYAVLTTYEESSLSVATASVSRSCDTSYLRMSAGTITAPDGGSLYIGQNTVKANTITQTSSRRHKKEIEDYTDSALDIICNSKIKSYRYNSEPSTEEINEYKAIYEDYDYKKHIGVIVEESNPCIVNQCGDGLDLGAMIAVTWKAIQEFENEYKILIKRMSELEELVCR